jgi:LPXTG-motif cell wall-anchored protein
MISLVASDPEKASELATQESMKRAEETFARLKEIESSMEERVAALPTDSETSDTSAGSTNSYLLLGLGVVAALGIAGLIYFQKKSKAGS